MIEYWYLLPVAAAIATTAMTFGIGGAALFSPLFIIVLGLPASLAVGLGLFIEIFGFSSGLIGFAKEKLINYRCARFALVASIPAAIIGVLISQELPETLITLLLATLLLVLAVLISKPDTKRLPKRYQQTSSADAKNTYTKPSPYTTRALHALGGLFAGLTSTGLGEINDYVYLKHYRMSGALAAGTSVFVVAITVLLASAVHVAHLQAQHLPQILGILVWVVPGVIIGAQLGVQLSKHVSDTRRDQLTTVLFVLIAAALILSILT